MSVTTNEQSATDTLVTPFASLSAYHAAAEDTVRQSPVLESPFASLLAESPDPESEEVAGFVESLHDEDFGRPRAAGRRGRRAAPDRPGSLVRTCERGRVVRRARELDRAVGRGGREGRG
jgi:hypothetical protein